MPTWYEVQAKTGVTTRTTGAVRVTAPGIMYRSTAVVQPTVYTQEVP